MKLFSLLFFLIITIQCIQSKLPHRTYKVIRDNKIKGKQLSAYTVYDSSEKNILYQLKPSSTDIDTIRITDYPADNLVAILEGQWGKKAFNTTFSIYDKKLTKWMNGTIKKDSSKWLEKYLIHWHFKYLHTRINFLSANLEVFNTEQKELLAVVRDCTGWFSTIAKYELKIYSSEYPDAIYLFLLAIKDHRWQIYY